MKKHSIRIEAKGHRYLSRVYLDGELMGGVMAVRVDLSAKEDTLVTLTFVPSELILEGDDLDVEMTVKQVQDK